MSETSAVARNPAPGGDAPGPGPGPVPVADARTRLPREPYPGLRPFLDFEAALLFGRERQVREVIERLHQTQFVAVLGGSGSGKSSLIHAGVVPELRSFGIPGAGDLWLPMTCTPGTNVSAEDSAARRHSPITRLARRFGKLLKSRGSDAADADRVQEIAQIFRQEAGFARLLETYQPELAIPPGPDVAEARVLFVLDQFEELFHPTNKDVEDATLLVERVLDHFFNPHPRCHVVLTMRSEHLNDCATFLELPDAINKSSYLIRRLDDDELMGAITGPAQRFLRLMARSEQAKGDAARVLPSEVVFEPEVQQRLLRDARAITHDPDHLPLLQHLLARLWEAALEREEVDMPVPARVTQADLVRAVNAGNGASAGNASDGTTGSAATLADSTNTLRASVENWAESIYRMHSPAQQVLLDSLFRRLAFKDPNTGLYSQQRVDVDACARQLGNDLTRVELRALIAEGFLGSVDYLFWDDEDPTRVTLKVSHESFIRGWLRFRRLVDKESERFDEFVGVLRRCSAWAAAGRNDDFLLETGEMRILRDSAFQARLSEAGQRAAWMRFLLLDRDGPRLAAAEPELDAFLAATNQRQQDRERHGKQTRTLGLGLTAAALLLLPPALFSIFVQGPVTQRAELLFDASNRANVAPLAQDYAGIGSSSGAGDPLQSLLTAAELIDNARTGSGKLMSRLSESLLNGLAWVPQVKRQDAFLSKIEAQAEPPVNGKLRLLLSNALWPAAPRQPNDESLGSATVLPDIDCAAGPGEPGMQGSLRGRLLVAGGRAGITANVGTVQKRAIFVPQFSGDTDTHIILRGASYDSASHSCQFGPTVLPIPLTLGPRVLFDSGLRYFVYSADGSNGEVPSVTLHEIDWERVEDNSARVVQSQVRTVVTGPQAVALLSQAVGADRVAVSESWRTPGGRAFAVGDEAWRVVSPSAQRLPATAQQDTQFTALTRAAAGSACDRVQAGWQGPPGLRPEMWQNKTHCFFITRGNADGPADNAGSVGGASTAALAPGVTAALREQVLVAVYEQPDDDALQRMAENPLAPIASLSQFARVPPSDSEWLVGTKGSHAGWLALRGHDSAGAVRLLGVPWSTCALWRLGHTVAAAASAPLGAAAQPRPAGAANKAGICVDH